MDNGIDPLDQQAEALLYSIGKLQQHRAFIESDRDSGACGCELVDGGYGLCLAGQWEEGVISSQEVVTVLRGNAPIPLDTFEVQPSVRKERHP